VVGGGGGLFFGGWRVRGVWGCIWGGGGLFCWVFFWEFGFLRGWVGGFCVFGWWGFWVEGAGPACLYERGGEGGGIVSSCCVGKAKKRKFSASDQKEKGNRKGRWFWPSGGREERKDTQPEPWGKRKNCARRVPMDKEA